MRGALLDRLARVVAGAKVLDLFAGSGALGFEALSRGAASCDFVEFRPSSLHALKANVTALRLRDVTRIFRKDALPFMDRLAAGTYDVAFADPPYTSRLAMRTVTAWQTVKFATVLAVEHAPALALPAGGEVLAFADSVVTIYRA